MVIKGNDDYWIMSGSRDDDFLAIPDNCIEDFGEPNLGKSRST